MKYEPKRFERKITVDKLPNSTKKEVNILVLALFLASLRGSIFWPFYAKTSSLFSVAWLEVGAWILLAVLIVRMLRKDSKWMDFVRQWRGEKALLAFLVVAFLSIFWSISVHASLYRTAILVFSTFTGAYLGYRYGVRGLVSVIFWFGAIVVILSFAFALLLPQLSVMSGYPYYGSWRGIYWHRNHLGAISALLNAVFLLRILAGYRERLQFFVLDLIFYVLSLILVYLASSAAGYILTLVLHFVVILLVTWLKISPHLKTIHYISMLGITVAGAVFVLSNLDVIFGLFNRQPNLTGRIPMWDYLLKNVISRSPWIGFGFGAIWTIPSFRTGLQQTQGWPFPILIGDNGFIDILLHVGLIGLSLFLAFWVRAWILSFKHGIQQRNLLDFFPLVFLVFTLFANISFSLFLETESFVWLMLVAVSFACARDERGSN